MTPLFFNPPLFSNWKFYLEVKYQVERLNSCSKTPVLPTFHRFWELHQLSRVITRFYNETPEKVWNFLLVLNKRVNIASTCLVRFLLFYLEIEIDNRYACYSIITVKIIIIRRESHIDLRTERNIYVGSSTFSHFLFFFSLFSMFLFCLLLTRNF